MNRRQNVPYTLDVVVLERDVRMIQIGPIRNRFGQLAPFMLIFKYAGFTLFDEGLHAVILDFLLAGDAQLLLYAQLNRKPVRIPARFPDDMVALHRLVAAYKILDDAAEHVTDMRRAVRGWRTFVKYIIRLAGPKLD
ncbi:Uncharacterised protein [Actinobacillus pleuropneumoniae]|nr:Uncharacterised protein [Actinobacillus pleuropneumoniae]